jgi:hypothetical protein
MREILLENFNEFICARLIARLLAETAHGWLLELLVSCATN